MHLVTDIAGRIRAGPDSGATTHLEPHCLPHLTAALLGSNEQSNACFPASDKEYIPDITRKVIITVPAILKLCPARLTRSLNSGRRARSTPTAA